MRDYKKMQRRLKWDFLGGGGIIINVFVWKNKQTASHLRMSLFVRYSFHLSWLFPLRPPWQVRRWSALPHPRGFPVWDYCHYWTDSVSPPKMIEKIYSIKPWTLHWNIISIVKPYSRVTFRCVFAFNTNNGNNLWNRFRTNSLDLRLRHHLCNVKLDGDIGVDASAAKTLRVNKTWHQTNLWHFWWQQER